jgi:hypothetical protein
LKNERVLKIIDDYFKSQQLTDAQIFNILRLYIYEIKSMQYGCDLHMLGKLLPPSTLEAVTNYYDGDVIKPPKKSELLESTFLSICFFLKEIKGWDWIKIKEFINLPEADKDLLSSISIGKQINHLRESMGKDIMDLIKTMNLDGLQDVLKEVKK